MILLEAARLHVNLHQKRKFVRTWLKDVPWVTYDVEANQVFQLDRDNTTCSDS